MGGGNSHQRAMQRAKTPAVAVSELRPSKSPELPNRKSKFGLLTEHLRTIEAVSFVLAIGAILMADYFWWFVLFTYVGLVIQIVYSFLDISAGRSRYFTATFFIFAALLFTYVAAVGRTYFESTSEWTEGNYNEGTDVHGIVWQSGWSELYFSISNKTDSDMKDFDLTFLVDEGVEKIAKVNDVGCNVVISGSHPIDVTMKSKDGQQQLLTPLGNTIPYQLICDKLPAHTDISLIIALGNTATLTNSLLNGSKKLPNNLGSNLLGPKRMPRWITYRAKYKVGLRPYSFSAQIKPFAS